MKNKLTSKFVFVSPHYDDAVGSCACLIDLLIREKYGVDILTVFSQQYFGNKSELAQDILDFCGLEDGVVERKIENQRACSYLHANDIDFLFYDAIYRKDTHGGWLYNSFIDLFGKVNEQDNMLLQMLLQKIKSKYIPHETFLFFPSAKGGHVDHKIVNQVGFILRNVGYNIAFYDEFSYNENYRYMSGLDRRKLLFSAEELYIKINAVKFYKSQHRMLFQDKSVEEYYINMNQLNDKWFELYYVFPGREDLADISAGGIPVLAHPMESLRGCDEERVKKVISSLGIDHIEFLTPKHTIDEVEMLERIIVHYDLSASIGSDSHKSVLSSIPFEYDLNKKYFKWLHHFW